MASFGDDGIPFHRLDCGKEGTGRLNMIVAELCDVNPDRVTVLEPGLLINHQIIYEITPTKISPARRLPAAETAFESIANSHRIKPGTAITNSTGY